MSYTFSIRAAFAPQVSDVWRRVGLPDVRCLEDLADAPWEEGITHFVRQGISARSLEISYEGGTFGVRIMSMSAPEDVDLGLRFAAAFGELLRAPITSEDEDEISPRELRAQFGDDWVRRHVESGPSMAMHLVKTDRSELTVPGAYRSLIVGPRFVDRLQKEAHPEAAFIESLRELQWIDTGRFREPSVTQAKSPGGAVVDFQVWSPDESVLLGPVEVLAIWLGKERGVLFLPTSAVEELMSGRTSWLGEKHVLVRAMPASEVPRLVERARAFEIFPLGKQKT